MILTDDFGANRGRGRVGDRDRSSDVGAGVCNVTEGDDDTHMRLEESNMK